MLAKASGEANGKLALTSPARIRIWLLRSLVGLSILAALAGPTLPNLGPLPRPLAIVDVSASVGVQPPGPPLDAPVATTWYAVADGVAKVHGKESTPRLRREATRLGAAFRQVAIDYPGRDVWCLTDGRSTDLDSEAGAGAIAAAGGRVHVSAPPRPAADVALVAARARRRSSGGIEVHARLAASTSGQGVVQMVRDGRAVAESAVLVESGTELALTLVDEAAPELAVAYTLTWRPGRGTPDDDGANDSLALGVAPDRPAVLVWGDLPPGAWTGPQVPFLVRRFAGWEGGVLDAADCVVLSNLPWSRLGEDRVRDLERFVAGGGRLLLLGGPMAWQGGGWAGTTLEEDLSPLRAPRPEGEGTAIVLAIDRSGSTAEGALAHLVRAARQAAGALAPGEQLAMLPFATLPAADLLEPGWVTAEDPEGRTQQARQLGTLLAGGGTDLAAAIQAAADQVQARPARERHVVLLTDGDPDARLDVEALRGVRARLDGAGVRFFAVVSGMPRVAERLRSALAQQPEDVVLLDDAALVPQQMLRSLASTRLRRATIDGPLRLGWRVPGDEALQALEPSWMQRLEVVPGAELLAEARRAEGTAHPFAARRTVGAGEVLAFAWGPAAETVPAAAAASLRSLVQRLATEADRGLHADVEEGELVLRLPEAAGRGRVEIRSPAGRGQLFETASGLFRGPLPCDCERGVSVLVPPREPDGVGRLRPLDLPTMPSPEHRGAGVDAQALMRIARAGAGRRLGTGEVPPTRPVPGGRPLAPWLLGLAGILLVLERAATEAARASNRSTG